MPKSKTKNRLKSRNKLSRSRLLVYACIFGVIGCLFLIRSLAAGTMTLYLSPAAQSFTKGDNFSVQVRLSNSTGNNVNQVNAYLTFPADKLSVNSITLDTSIFVFGNQSFDNTAGTAAIHNQAFSNLNNGDYPVATISFSAKASGTAVVSYTGQSSVVDSIRSTNNGNQLTGTSGGTYTISSPAPPPPPPAPPPKTPPPAPKSGSTGSSTPVSSSPTPSAPVISGLITSKIDSSSAQISWTTAPAAVSVLSFGLSADKLDNSLPPDAAFPNHSATLVNLAPGTKYYFSVKATANGADSLQTGDFTTLSSAAAQKSSNKASKPGGLSSKSWLAGAAVIPLALLLLAISRRLAGKPNRRRKKSGPKTSPSSKQQPLNPVAAPPPMPAPLFQRPPPQPKPQPQAAETPPPPVTNHQLPPSHATGYPWVVGAPTARQAKPRSGSIAADDPNYVEPQDLFEEGTKRLVDEGIITIPHDRDGK